LRKSQRSRTGKIQPFEREIRNEDGRVKSWWGGIENRRTSWVGEPKPLGGARGGGEGRLGRGEKLGTPGVAKGSRGAGRCQKLGPTQVRARGGTDEPGENGEKQKKQWLYQSTGLKKGSRNGNGRSRLPALRKNDKQSELREGVRLQQRDRSPGNRHGGVCLTWRYGTTDKRRHQKREK